jgi:hypothetical protein
MIVETGELVRYLYNYTLISPTSHTLVDAIRHCNEDVGASCNTAQNVLLALSWLVSLPAVAYISSADICANEYFRQNQFLLVVLGLSILLRYAAVLYFEAYKCGLDALEGGYAYYRSAECENGGGFAYFAYLLPMLPFFYLFLRFRAVVRMKQNEPFVSDLWIGSVILRVAAWICGNIGNCVLDRSKHLFYWVVLTLVDAALLHALIRVYRWSIRVGDTPTTTLYIMLHSSIFAGSMHTLTFVVIAGMVLEQQFTLYQIITGPMLFLGSLVTVVVLYSKFKARVRSTKWKERVYIDCLQARPPRPFAISEFNELWSRRVQRGNEGLLVDAVLSAADWCFADPARHWWASGTAHSACAIYLAIPYPIINCLLPIAMQGLSAGEHLYTAQHLVNTLSPPLSHTRTLAPPPHPPPPHPHTLHSIYTSCYPHTSHSPSKGATRQIFRGFRSTRRQGSEHSRSNYCRW